MAKPRKKRVYIIRKYVQAESIQAALLREKKQCADDVFLEETSQRQVIEDTLQGE